MATITLEITTPGNGKIYEFKVDNQILTSKFKKIVIEEILDVEKDNISLKFDDSSFASIRNEKLLDEKLTLYSNEVKSGHRILLL